MERGGREHLCVTTAYRGGKKCNLHRNDQIIEDQEDQSSQWVL